MPRAKKNFVDDPNKLNGAEKAAIVLLALGEDHHQLWQSLDEDEIKEISQAMSTLGTVTSGGRCRERRRTLPAWQALAGIAWTAWPIPVGVAGAVCSDGSREAGARMPSSAT